ncbi:hypothetical protein MKP05_07480 [Halomonas sp. EGI 63088]|uniref:Uncharacterized protein n=1 Tax=Halomonas flagellata TaxID=2920385 RepID=A0ABS9RT08_9GAMM|nr:hypothetical protein [Halomonas flagellata]
MMASISMGAICRVVDEWVGYSNYYLYITAHALIHEVLPRLHTIEALVNNTFDAVIEAASDPRERARREEQRAALELELFTIRLNVEHLPKRHPDTGSFIAMTASPMSRWARG